MDFDVSGTWKSQDAVEAGLHVDVEDTSITVDSDTEWDAVPTVDSKLVSESHRQFFDADNFYRFAVTTAKSIPQTYTVNDDEYTFLKPRGELQKASWSLENAPYALDHPKRGAVTDANDIHGFFHSTHYDASNESLNAKLTVPANDSEALEYLQQSSDVSIGFYNTLDTDADDVDAYQRDLYIDHVASVETGRCSAEDGCEVHI